MEHVPKTSELPKDPGIPVATIIVFPPLPHRIQVVLRRKGERRVTMTRMVMVTGSRARMMTILS